MATPSAAAGQSTDANDLHAEASPSKFVYNYTSADDVYGGADPQPPRQSDVDDNKQRDDHIYDEINYPACKTNEKTMA